MIGLAFFLTLFVMAPTFEAINQNGIQPYLAEQQKEEPGPEGQVSHLWQVAQQEIKKFMLSTNPHEEILVFMQLSQQTSSVDGNEIPRNPETGEIQIAVDQIPLKVLVPAFVISELKKAFIIGFLYLHSFPVDRFGDFLRS